MSSRTRVKEPPGAQFSGQTPAVITPWNAEEAAGATVLGQPDSAAGGTWPEQQQASTEVGQFEPLPDSPTGGRTAAGRGFDQQRQVSAELQQQPAAEVVKKLPPIQDAPRVIRQAAVTQGPFPGTAHVHLIGEITGAVGLGPGPLYCTWQLVYDARLWSIAGGQDKGRTHASSPLLSEDGSWSGVVWDCPVDILLTTSSMQHWPSIVFKLFHRSIWLGRDEFVGYSLCSLPNTPGCHHVSCPVWVAAEGRRSLPKELTKFFTGLHPQLVDESFITDLEQRFEQGQHLHTVACSTSTSTYDRLTHSKAMICTGGPGAAAEAAASAVGLGRAHCSSLSGASSGAAAVTGSGICLRLHVLTRGLEQLSTLRGDGGESIGRCLERLHSSVEKIRKQHARPKLQDLVGVDGDDDSQAEATEESHGVQLVREGRAARLQAVQQQLFGRDGDRARDRDQQQLQQLQPAVRRQLGSGAGQASTAGDRPTGSPGRSFASRSSFEAPGGAQGAAGSGTGNGGSPARQLRSLAALPEGSSSGGQNPFRRFGVGGVGGAMPGLSHQPLGGSPGSRGGAAAGQEGEGGGSPVRFRPSTDATGGSSSSPLRRDAAAVSSRWAGRFASAAGQSAEGSPVREGLLLPT